MTSGPGQAKRTRTSSDDVSISDSARDDDKTIPFLRRLTDMLKENTNVISFFPGHCKEDKKVLGRIVVHDRLKVESEVLPRYFNHASFASLRRQLNYFSFTRVGKGRQRGATYCNEAVVELDDILHLKRRTVGSVASVKGNPNKGGMRAQERTTTVPTESSLLLDGQLESSSQHRSKRGRTSSSPTLNPMTPPLGLTNNFVSDEETSSGDRSDEALEAGTHHDQSSSVVTEQVHDRLGYEFISDNYQRDEDILAGCKALLSFSKGFHVSGIPRRA